MRPMVIKESSKVSEESLEGFQKVFFDAVMRLSNIVADSIDFEIFEKEVQSVEDNIKIFVGLKKGATSSVTPTRAVSYANMIIEHFPAIYTPTYTRKYGIIEADKIPYKDEFRITALYK